MAKDIAVCGIRDGSIIFIDCKNFKNLYGFGAMNKVSVVRV